MCLLPWPGGSLVSGKMQVKQMRLDTIQSDAIVNAIGSLLVVLLIGMTFLLPPAQAEGSPLKVLVVMSYAEENPWCIGIRKSIDATLSDAAEISYFYMDTKKNMERGPQKAKEAFTMFEQLRPDGVITVDDNAQSMFAVPYLKDKTSVPVMFCGVNADPEKYGYPASNISGILERAHINEGLALTKQLSPSLNTILVLAADTPTGRAMQQQIEGEHTGYLAEIEEITLLGSMDELDKEQLDRVDAILLIAAVGVLDSTGKSLSYAEVLEGVSKRFHRPIIGVSLHHVRAGVLCAVVKTAQEQGAVAATMLLEAMEGKPVEKIPITRNYNGKRVINVTVLKEMGIQPNASALIGSELITSERKSLHER